MGKILHGIKTRTLGNTKNVRIWVSEGINLDIFIAEPTNWGMQLMIRTGSSDYSRSMLTKFNRKGYHSEEGYPIHKTTGERLDFEREEAVFQFLEMEYVNPENRIKM